MREAPTNICPLLAIASAGSSGTPSCIEEHCALWDYVDNDCALVSIPFAIRAISDGLTGIEDTLQGDGHG